MQTICVDLKEFKSIRELNGVYVDKTKHIYDVLGRGKYFFFARPRRFGKSLLCSTLGELFEGNRALFNGLWIDKSDWQWTKHPVIRLDMSKAASKSGTTDSLRQGITDLLLQNAKNLGITDLEKDLPFLMFRRLIEKANECYGQKTVVIIDEYDKPILDVIDDENRRKEIRQELSDFYSQLKPAEDNLRFVLITGVFKFTQTSIFSGLNNLNDITFSPKAAALLGYTEDEISIFFAEHLQALAAKANTSIDAMMDILRRKYNGYVFGVDILAKTLGCSVYNPFALNYVFNDLQLLDKWFASGSPTAMMKKLSAEGFTGFDAKRLNIEFNTLNTSCSPTNITPISMLYYAGYVTMHNCYLDTSGENPVVMLQLNFPSSEVRNAYAKHLLPELLNKSFDHINQFALQIKDIFREQKLADLQEVLNDLLSTTTYQIFTRSHDRAPKENLYQIAFHCLFIVANFKSVMEDSTNQGRIDITVELPHVVYLFELKMNEPADSAIQQIKHTDYPKKFKLTQRTVYGIGVSIDKEKRTVSELAWEML
ncbi:hypothetical protein FJ365_05740 [Candidatus Dependentiae bacterium]|nr:hypothetical protein [Candidatus Dependentiae bacterium]